MKKILLVILVVALVAVSAFACSGKTDETSVVIAFPTGGPALALSYLIKECPTEIDGAKVTYRAVQGDSGIKLAFTNLTDTVDMAIMPTNIAAQLYNGGMDIKLVATNSYGLLYMISDEFADGTFSIEALKGHVVHAVGKAGTPGIVLKKVLGDAYVESNTAEDGKVAVVYHTDGSEIISAIKLGDVHTAVLGEPAVTSAMANTSMKIVLDLQAAWKSATGSEKSYPQTCLVVKGDFLKKNEKLVQTIAKYTLYGSIELKKDATPMIEALKSIQAAYPASPKSIERANIDPKFGAGAKADVEEFFTILKDINFGAIGGVLPDAGFYYIDSAFESDMNVIKAFA